MAWHTSAEEENKSEKRPGIWAGIYTLSKFSRLLWTRKISKVHRRWQVCLRKLMFSIPHHLKNLNLNANMFACNSMPFKQKPP